MKTALLCLFVCVLTGCASQAQRDLAVSHNNFLNYELQSSIEAAKVSCSTTKMCAKAFNLAKVFVQENADMKIQVSDDTIISTYNPIKSGYIGMSATKTPGPGDSAEIKLNAVCRGTSLASYDLVSTNCKKRLAIINNEFAQYIEARLN